MVHNVSESLVLDSRPALVQRFETVRHLGDGAAGSVFLVRDRKRDNLEVALKVLINGTAFDENTIARFEQELEASQGVNHPNLIQAYDYIDLGDTIAFTMEYVPGKDLGATFASQPLTLDEIDMVFDQLLSGMAELHRHGIIHRDIKLENIILSMDGTVKLSDLGLMKRLNSEGMTRTGVLLGTAQYLPPEYIKKTQYDQRGDVYAAGTVLLELLTQKRRLSDKPGMEAIEHLIKTNFAVPKLSLTGLPRRYRQIVTKALAYNPDDRYQSADEMLDAFCSPDTVAESYMGEGEAVGQLGLTMSKRINQAATLNGPTHSSRLRWRLLTWIVASAAMVLLFVFATMTWRTYNRYDLFEFGLYRGVLAGGEQRWPIEIRIDQRGIFLSSAMNHCSEGQLSRLTGTVDCGDVFRLEMGDVVNGRYSGELVSTSSGKVYLWSVQPVAQEIIR